MRRDGAEPAAGSGGQASAGTPGEAEILAAIAEIGRRELGWEGPVEPGMRLIEDLELDSLRLLTLAVAVENRFEICLSEEDEAAIQSLGDLARVVGRRLAEEGR